MFWVLNGDKVHLSKGDWKFLEEKPQVTELNWDTTSDQESLEFQVVRSLESTQRNFPLLCLLVLIFYPSRNICFTPLSQTGDWSGQTSSLIYFSSLHVHKYSGHRLYLCVSTDKHNYCLCSLERTSSDFLSCFVFFKRL